MGAGKTFQIYMPGDLVDSFKQRAADEAQGNESGYVQALHRSHISSTPSKNATNATALVDLARVFHPTLASSLALQLNSHASGRGAVNQPRVIARLLEALNIALEGNVDPEAQISLVDAKKAQEWEKVGDERVLSAASELAALLNQEGMARLSALLKNQSPGVNEDPAAATSLADDAIAREVARRGTGAKPADAHSKPPHTPKTPKR